MHVLKGVRDGRTYDLHFADNPAEVKSVQRREEANGFYSDFTIVDLDEFQLQEYRKLSVGEIDVLARQGDPLARQVQADREAAAREAEAAANTPKKTGPLGKKDGS